MKATSILTSLLLVGATACSMLPFVGESDPERRFEQALADLSTGNLARAQEHLHSVATNHARERIGRKALLVLVAAELDPRNPERRLWAAADMSARLLSPTGEPEWAEPIAETLYLLSLELGANEERIARAEAARDSAEALPKLPGPSFVAQMDALRAQRDSLRRRTVALEQSVSAKETELKEKDQELQRILKTLKGGGG